MRGRWTRWWRHAWLDARDARRALPPEATARLVRAVADSERQHSGEIRICVEGGLPWSWLRSVRTDDGLRAVVRQRARDWFGRLGVWDTAQNNGVLVYLLLAERAIEIVADRGLDGHVSPAQWQAIAARLSAPLQAGRFEDGLVQAVADITPWLVGPFPAPPGQPNANELPDAVVLA